MSSSPENNPQMHNWNKVRVQTCYSDATDAMPDVYTCRFCAQVFLVYCDGGSFSGTLTEPINYNGTDLYFSGFYNLNAILDDLAGRHGLFNVCCSIFRTVSDARLFVLYLTLALAVSCLTFVI